MNSFLIAGSIAVVVIFGAVFFVNTKNTAPVDEGTQPANNVYIEDGKQIVEIDAKGGYIPRKSIAQAGIPTVIRFNTVTTFDCSASVRIPSLDISKILPQTGKTDIDVGVQAAGPLEGSCGMGMYPFEVVFE